MNCLKLKPYHTFKIKNSYFLFLVRSMEIYEIDEETYQMCFVGEDNQYEISCEDTAVLEELQEAGLAASEEDDLEEEKIKKMEVTNQEKDRIISSIVLQVSNDCNLNCLYCYGGGGCYNRKRELMTFETAKAALDFLMEHRGEHKEVSVTFFGGEPLLNVPLIKECITYCKTLEKENDVKIKFSMTTNGTIMTEEILEMIKSAGIHVMVSMDGNKELQNTYRCYESGEGSFDDIRRNIPKLKEIQPEISARATLCKKDPHVKKIREDLLSYGFTHAYVTEVDAAKDSPLYVGEKEKAIVRKEYEEIAMEYIDKLKRGEKAEEYMFNRYLNQLYYKYIKLHGCDAQVRSCAIGTNGKIYPCQRFMGMDEYITGDVLNGELKQFYVPTVLEKEKCNTCWARYLCAGGCSHSSVTNQGDVYKAPTESCHLQLKLCELSIYIYYALKEFNPDIFNQMFETEHAVKDIHDPME